MCTPPAYLNLFAYETLHNNVGPREPIRLTRPTSPIEHDIVLLIDESVAGHYLDTNTPFGLQSGLQTPPDGVEIFHYGYALSISNCSSDTNVSLRSGGTRDDDESSEKTTSEIQS